MRSMVRKRAFAVAAHLPKAPVTNTYQPVWKLLWRSDCLCINSLSEGKHKDTCTSRWLRAHPDPSLQQELSLSLFCKVFVLGEPS